MRVVCLPTRTELLHTASAQQHNHHTTQHMRALQLRFLVATRAVQRTRWKIRSFRISDPARYAGTHKLESPCVRAYLLTSARRAVTCCHALLCLSLCAVLRNIFAVNTSLSAYVRAADPSTCAHARMFAQLQHPHTTGCVSASSSSCTMRERTPQYPVQKRRLACPPHVRTTTHTHTLRYRHTHI